MNSQTILLKAIKLNAEELELLIKIAIKLIYVDKKARIEEWSVVSLIPALIAVVKDSSSADIKKEWEQKLEVAGKSLQQKVEQINIKKTDIKSIIKEKAKREAFLLILFMVLAADRKIDKREIEYVIDRIAKPWNYAIGDLIELIKNHKEEITSASNVINVLMDYY